MLKGQVELHASVESNPIVFGEVSLPGHDPSIDCITLQSDETNGMKLSVSICDVTTQEEGSRAALNEAERILDIIAFERHIAIAQPRIASQSFQPIREPKGQHTISVGMTLHMKCNAAVVSRVDCSTIANQILNSAPVSLLYKSMFRGAVRSKGGVERFMHLYNLLMMLHCDHQGRLDQFIRSQEPNVPDTPSPHLKGVNETVYTRLRNELGHHRAGGDLERTKQEMHQQVGQLLLHVRTAIMQSANSTGQKS